MNKKENILLEFSGELSDKLKKSIKKRVILFNFCILFFVCLLFSITALILTITSPDNYGYIWVGTFLVMPFCVLIPPGQKSWELIFPTKVYFDIELIICEGKRFEERRFISDVKNVIDCGDYYYIKFLYPERTPKYICQKDLLKNGTIEDFEKIFADKIIRKIKK